MLPVVYRMILKHNTSLMAVRTDEPKRSEPCFGFALLPVSKSGINQSSDGFSLVMLSTNLSQYTVKQVFFFCGWPLEGLPAPRNVGS